MTDTKPTPTTTKATPKPTARKTANKYGWLGPAVVVGGLLTLAVAGSWGLLFPGLRRLRHLRQDCISVQ